MNINDPKRTTKPAEDPEIHDVTTEQPDHAKRGAPVEEPIEELSAVDKQLDEIIEMLTAPWHLVADPDTVRVREPWTLTGEGH